MIYTVSKVLLGIAGGIFNTTLCTKCYGVMSTEITLLWSANSNRSMDKIELKCY